MSTQAELIKSIYSGFVDDEGEANLEPLQYETQRNTLHIYGNNTHHMHQIMPNKMQVRALAGIDKIRQSGGKSGADS